MKKVVLTTGILFACLVGCEPAPWVGTFNRDDYLTQCPWKSKIASRYRPRPEIRDRLKALRDSTDVLLFMGTWCSDSRKHVPRFMLLYPDLPIRRFEIVGVDTTKKDANGLWKKWGVDSVPTFVFTDVYGVELGRIKVKPRKQRLEEAVLRILER
ncbi:MAG: hypothetical protein RMM53_06170 [Bacteroidia bacterium]|nr:hypothetical protein [Bacteroidia bacterium]MDW8333781.1 hypothetical protein [Bacteroidia bacterium]